MPASTPSNDQLLVSTSAILPVGDAAYILGLARDLSRRRDAASRPLRIKGRNVAMVSPHENDGMNMFRDAALELGVHVSHIQPSLTEASSREDIEHTSRLLGRLYSAIEWPSASPALMKQIRKEAAIPVYGGISVRGNPLHAWSVQLDIEATDDDKWRFVIQAILLRDLG